MVVELTWIRLADWDESGQSLLEFLFLLPMMIGLSIILIKVNTVIQAGIVDQQYARMQTQLLTFNSAYYPQGSPEFLAQNFEGKGYNSMVIGVAGSPLEADDAGNVQPDAFTYAITRNKRLERSGNDDPHTEPSSTQGRAKVRVRNTVALCTQSRVVASNGNLVAATPEVIRSMKHSKDFVYCNNPLPPPSVGVP